MLNVLLADDNYIILEYFSQILRWEEYGFQIVSTAMNGEKAFLNFQKYRPDLVITDIQMPRMDGIELARKIREVSPDTVILFLTSYEEFSYVKAGIDLGVFGYLLKHETTPSQLAALLEKVRKAIHAKKLQLHYASAPLHAMIRELSDGVPEEAVLSEYEQCFPDRYTLILLEQDHINPVIGNHFHRKTPPVPEKTFLRFCSEAFESLTAAIPNGEYRFLLFLRSDASVSGLSYEVQDKLSQRFRDTFFELILADHASISECAKSYAAAAANIGQRIFYPRASIAHAGYMRVSSASSIDFPARTLQTQICQLQFDEVSSAMGRAFSGLLEQRDDKNMNRLLSCFLSLLLPYDNKSLGGRAESSFSLYENGDEANWFDAASCFQWLNYRFARLSLLLSQTNYCQYSSVVQRAVDYISANYANSDLSADLISEVLGCHPNQLNLLFKREIGETVWKFITRVRMERAKALLCAGRDKVTDICQASGYKNISYFSKVFKSTYGTTPLEYRRAHNET